MKKTIVLIMLAGVANAATYYVDSERGDDAADGLTPEAAWRTLERVNNTALQPGDTVRFKRGGLWRGSLRGKSGEPGAPVVFTNYGEGPKPVIQGSVDRSQPSDWEASAPGIWATRKSDKALSHDVGIFLVNHGEKWGVKKWKLADLKNDLDYWDDRENLRIFVKSETNPGERFASIELALTRHIVDNGGLHDLVYDGLAIRYTGAHGFGGGWVRNTTIRNCDIYWIGGGLQFWQKSANKNSYPVRFGNGIEFWTRCDNCLVERNRLWQIYDAALTNQGSNSPGPETNVTWRDNVIWQAEYSFEYWNHDPTSRTTNILFEHNTCVDAGYGWAHNQRPDKNGAHLMFYDNSAPTTNFVVRNNLFARSVDRAIRLCNDWRKDFVFTRNLYWMPENNLFEYTPSWREQHTLGIKKGCVFGGNAEAFKSYQAKMQMDLDSVYGEPQFINEARRDYRLKPGTFGSNLATDGGPLGARDMPGLDRDQSAKN